MMFFIVIINQGGHYILNSKFQSFSVFLGKNFIFFLITEKDFYRMPEKIHIFSLLAAVHLMPAKHNM